MQTMKLIPVYNMRYAMILKKMGHTCIDTMPNPKDNRYTVWIFEVDDTFEKDLSALVEEGKTNGRH